MLGASCALPPSPCCEGRGQIVLQKAAQRVPGAKSRGFTKLHTGLEGLTLQAVPRRTSLGDRASLVAWRVWHLGGGRERERPGKGGGALDHGGPCGHEVRTAHWRPCRSGLGESAAAVKYRQREGTR